MSNHARFYRTSSSSTYRHLRSDAFSRSSRNRAVIRGGSSMPGLLGSSCSTSRPCSWTRPGSYWRKNPPEVVPRPVESPPPIPQPFPIKLDADHAKEVERNLGMLADELQWVKRRPEREVLLRGFVANGVFRATELPEDN